MTEFIETTFGELRIGDKYFVDPDPNGNSCAIGYDDICILYRPHRYEEYSSLKSNSPVIKVVDIREAEYQARLDRVVAAVEQWEDMDGRIPGVQSPMVPIDTCIKDMRIALRRVD